MASHPSGTTVVSRPTGVKGGLPPPSVACGQSRSLRIGVLGGARVLFKSWPAIYSAGHRVTCIGCRDADRALAMAKEIIEKMTSAAGTTPAAITMPRLGTYEHVVHSADVDVVYITLPVSIRNNWVRACAEAGKHVVGEKPAALDAAELMDWLEAFSVRRLVFMDGTHLTHCSRTRLVRDKVAELGVLRHVDANFSFLASGAFRRSDIRCDTRLEPHGALGDLGWYAIRWILHLFDFATPTHVSGAITAVTASGAIAAFEGHLTLPPPQGSHSADDETATTSPATASFYCSFLSAHQQTVRAYTTGGTVEVHGAINPTDKGRLHFLVRRTECNADRNTADGAAETDLSQLTLRTEKVYCTPEGVDGSPQAVELWRHVGNSLVQLGVGEPLVASPSTENGGSGQWGRYAYLTQLVMDKLLESAKMMPGARADASLAAPQN